MPVTALAEQRAPGDNTGQHARRWLLAGQIQGVGFRPFIYRLALQYGLTGWVRNLAGQVEIIAQGRRHALDEFAGSVLGSAPPLARPVIHACDDIPALPLTGFRIRDSEDSGVRQAYIPPDWFVCDDCLRELHDPDNRRYRYPFINCTQCGPRYSIIRRLPYDRSNTTLAGFTLCPACAQEYSDACDRRFHAEPIACPVCGPQLQFYSDDAGIIDAGGQALDACVTALLKGFIVAVKGIGGYHLMCNAADRHAVSRLRAAKPRPHKPLAVMFPWRGSDGLDAVRSAAVPEPMHAELLTDPMRPIVLLPLRPGTDMAAHIAPGLDEIGVMLPYSPLHHLLLEDTGMPLVATSANLSGDPVITDNLQAEQQLAGVADAFLHHTRPIRRPADDPVFRIIDRRPRPLRLGRGNAPLELVLPFTLREPLLALGAHMKNTIALAWDNRVVISPHNGDLESARSQDVFEQVVHDLQQLYRVQPAAVVCDAHPGYYGTRWARRSGLPVKQVFHHHAHASAVAGEYPQISDWLMFAWDGVGYGADATLWGGEAFTGHAGNWQRAASLRPFRLPGGHMASREPWRSALGLCWETGQHWPACPEPDTSLLHQSWQQARNAPLTTAAGRLFDGAAALLGMVHNASHEAQGPMLLEACSTRTAPATPLPLARNSIGLWETDWSPLLTQLLDTGRPQEDRAGSFHASLAQALTDQALTLRMQGASHNVGLCGGVFQNRLLTEQVCARLRAAGFTVYLGELVPCNDAGISYGQIIDAGRTAKS